MSILPICLISHSILIIAQLHSLLRELAVTHFAPHFPPYEAQVWLDVLAISMEHCAYGLRKVCYAG